MNNIKNSFIEKGIKALENCLYSTTFILKDEAD